MFLIHSSNVFLSLLSAEDDDDENLTSYEKEEAQREYDRQKQQGPIKKRVSYFTSL